MKNDGHGPDASQRPSEAWAPGPAPLRPRAAAPRRRRAHPPRLRRRRAASSPRGRPRQRLEPGRGRLPRPAPLRRARCPTRGRRARAPLARKLASIARLLPRAGRARRAAPPTRPTCSPRRSARSRCPRTLKPHEVAALLDRIPATHAARAARPRACSSSPTPAACAARRSSTSTCGSVDFDARAAAGARQGLQDALRAGRRARAARARRAIWSAAAGALAAGRRSRRCSSPRPAGGCRPRTSAAACGLGAPRRGSGRGPSARPAALVRHPPARGRGGPARDPGAAGPRSVSTTQVYTRVESARLRPRTSAAIRGRRRRLTLETNVKAIELQGALAPLQGEAATSGRASSSSSPTRRW